MLSLGSTARIHYVGTLDDGRIFYSTRLQGGAPFEFRVGQREILPALEERVRTMQVGDRATFTVPAAQAYGEYDETLKETVDLADLPNGDQLEEGQFVVFSTEDGPLRVKVERIKDGKVTFDLNHELAGYDLTFTVDLLAVMDPNSMSSRERFYAKADDECGCASLHGHSHDHNHDQACVH